MNIFQKYLAEEFAEDYSEGRISHQQALQLISSITGNSNDAASILAASSPREAGDPVQFPVTGVLVSHTASAATTGEPGGTTQRPVSQVRVSPDDLSISAGPVDFPDEDVTLHAYLARPAGNRPSPVVLVCHENRGLTEHIQDVARRLAKAGYVALAVDLLSHQGGTPSVSPEEVPGILSKQPPEQFVQDFLSGWNYLRGQPFADPDRVGMVGFCFGGGVTWLVAARMPQLKAAVPFYGPPPPVQDIPNIQAAVLAIYGALDQRINQTIPTVEDAMKQNQKIYEKIIYPNADHAFHNDTGSRYVPEAAQDAWKRTLDWFTKYV